MLGSAGRRRHSGGSQRCRGSASPHSRGGGDVVTLFRQNCHPNPPRPLVRLSEGCKRGRKEGQTLVQMGFRMTAESWVPIIPFLRKSCFKKKSVSRFLNNSQSPTTPQGRGSVTQLLGLTPWAQKPVSHPETKPITHPRGVGTPYSCMIPTPLRNTTQKIE